LSISKRIAIVVGHIRVGGKAPDCLLAIRVSAEVVITKAFVWTLRRYIVMRLRVLAGPSLAGASSFSRTLSTAVICSLAGEFLIHFYLLLALVSASRSGSPLLFLCLTWRSSKWFAGFPALGRISSVAPYSFIFAIRVSAIAVIAYAEVWVFLRCSSV